MRSLNHTATSLYDIIISDQKCTIRKGASELTETNNINIRLIQPLIKEFPLTEDHMSAFSYISIEEYPIHSHLHMELIYVAEGSLSIKVGVSDYVLHAGEFTIINPFELHALYSTGEPNKTCILEISTDFYDPCAEGTIFVSYYNLYRDAAGSDFSKITDTMKKIFTLHLSAAEAQTADVPVFPSGVGDNNAEYEKILLRSLINYFELHFTSEYFLLSDHRENTLRDNALQANRLKSILTYFYEHFPQKIQLQDVADVTFVNRYHISHLVKSGIGFTFSELLQHIRIEKAEIYLLGTDMPISRIVSELGFSSYRYFSQHFKNLFNMTPNEYRKKDHASTIRHKDLSYITPTLRSDVINAVRSFSSAEPQADTKAGTKAYPDADPDICRIRVAELLSSGTHPSQTFSSPGQFPELLYDSPYFPALLLDHMNTCMSSLNAAELKDIIGSDKNTYAGGIRKSVFYLNKLLEPFISTDTIAAPGCFMVKSDDEIRILIYDSPVNMGAFSAHTTLADADSLEDAIKNIIKNTEPVDKRFIIQLGGLEDGSFLIQKCSLKTELDGFSQLRRTGLSALSDKNIVEALNASSEPDTVLDRLDTSVRDTSFEVCLKPFQVQFITLRHFTRLP